MSFTLKVFGGVSLAAHAGPLSGSAVQRHRLAVLAVLAVSHPRAVSRDKLLAWLWPERDAERARGLLNQAIYTLRQTLGADAVLTAGDDLRLNRAVVDADVIAFEEALAAGAPERAVALYAGALLDGFFLDDAAEFGHWVERERDRLARAYARALEGLAEAADGSGNAREAAEWWKVRSSHDPYDSRVALRLVEAEERAGNVAGALQHAMSHLQRLKDELGLAAPPEVVRAVERLRSERAVTPVARMSVPPVAPAATPAATPTREVRTPPSPARRRTLWYGTAVVAAALAIGGGIRLATRTGETRVVAAPAVVDEIAQAVARELDRRARGDTARSLPQRRTRSIPAYELYLRGSDPTLLRSDSGARRGLAYFRQAVALDSSYAAAWAGLARMTFRVAFDRDFRSAAAARSEAEAAARKAVALDDSLAEAHAVLGMMRAMAYDFPAGERHLRRAIALEPARARIREWAATFYLLSDRPAEALAEAERALALEPLSSTATAEVARALLANGRCDEALDRLEGIAALDPPLLRAAPLTALCYARQGRWASAIALLRPLAERDETRTLSLLGYMLARAGERGEALAIQERLIGRWRQGIIGAFDLACVPAALGDRDRAFAWLDRAYEDGSLGSPSGWRVGFEGPPFDVLRQDPRMGRLRARLGLQNR
jgi:DNA-binding SARP family transcriptional activator